MMNLKQTFLKRENAATIVAFAIVGAGAGLLIGSIVAAKLAARREDDWEEVLPVDADGWYDDDTEVEYRDESIVVTSRRAVINEPRETKKTIARKTSIQIKGEDTMGKASKTHSKSERLDQAEFDYLSGQYPITAIQQQLYDSGVLSLDDLREALEEQYGGPGEAFDDLDLDGDDEYYDYGNKPDIMDIKPSNAVDYSKPPFVRTNIKSDVPADLPVVNAVYHENENGLFRVLGDGRQLPYDNPEEVIGEGMLDEVYDQLLFEDGVDKVYIVDSVKGRVIAITNSEPGKKYGDLDDATFERVKAIHPEDEEDLLVD